MIELLIYPSSMGLYSPSPFCTKAAYLLQLSGQDWTRTDLSDPRKMPNGKLPVIRAEGRLIADSDAIREYLESKGADFDAGLSEDDKAASQAVIRMVEEHLYFLLMHDRWANEAVWPEVSKAYFAHLPPVMRNVVPFLLRRDVLKTLHGQGVSRFTDEERLARADKDISAIATLLGDKPFLFGNAPTSADCSVAASLVSIRTSPVDTPLSLRVAQDPVISAYLDRFEEAVPLA